MVELKQSILSVYQEHMKNEDLDGFMHDLAVLIGEGLDAGFSIAEMTKRFNEYTTELKDFAND